MFRSVRNKVIMTLCAVCLASALQALPAVAAEAFDPVFYAASNPDVVAVLGTDPQALLNYYLNYGIREGRLPYEGASPEPLWTESHPQPLHRNQLLRLLSHGHT